MESNQFAPIFLKAFQAVCKEYDFSPSKVEPPTQSNKKFILTRGIDVLIYFTLELEGMLVLSFTEEEAMNLAKKIDMDPESVDLELTREIIAEIGNLTAARANALMTKKGITTNITPPSIFCGKGSQIYSMVPDLIKSSMTCEFGTTEIFCAMRQREKQIVFVD